MTSFPSARFFPGFVRLRQVAVRGTPPATAAGIPGRVGPQRSFPVTLSKNRLTRSLARAWRGASSLAACLAWPLGGWWLGGTRHLGGPARRAHGLAVVLPGVEGRGPLNWSIAHGLADGGFPGAVLVHDWTTGLWPLLLFHLRASRRNRRQASLIAETVLAYQDAYPGRPVYLVGHSGGAALAGNRRSRRLDKPPGRLNGGLCKSRRK
jgi:hypothetical protein